MRTQVVRLLQNAGAYYEERLCAPAGFLHILAKLRAQHLAMEPSYQSEPVLPLLFGSQRDIVLLSFVLHKKSKSNPVLYGRRPRPLSARRINLEAYQRRRPFSPRACPIN